ncbi:hypothetical protein LF845_00115 [Deferribacterales bacterium Es71-Z0220]|uniref:glycoside hydrolase family 57 protein n=1 Tax=Deferrivibrio essentukiensis TaxID=2880922 RepID=UPI001F606A42|nr:glycoside hydrolase family 57 protein [Deferrivibrio essentukiensis]MCB4203358.1 hypothetical protein [Deferrivibrio essentukiensis]
MKKLYLQFIWHMHQPYYKEASTGEYLLPWVFLHGIKDYLEMPRYYELYDIKGTFNFVPSLLIQLEDYKSEDVNDRLIKLIKKDVKTLEDKEIEFLVPSLFMANLKNMISSSVRYKELYDRYSGSEKSENKLFIFNSQEILDLEVHFLIAWTGAFIRSESSFIKSLIVKDMNFTEDDKRSLLKILFGKISYIFEYYKKLSDMGRIELSVTPYYHPIFPLLLDMNCAYESKKDIKLPLENLRLDEDAKWHLNEGVKEFERIFGVNPTGVWPAEGSVSDETVTIFSDKFKWCATDEDVLGNSLGIDLKRSDNRKRLYKRYIFGDEKISVFFRDKYLSDLIGFTYANMEPVEAACDFIKKLQHIYEICDFDPIVSVILDGENAWEFYKNNAFDFFSALYERLMKLDFIQTVTPKEMLKADGVKLKKVVAGSWIYGDFTTWVGHPEKNKAWEYLYEVKKDLIKLKGDDNIEEAEKFLHIAEGSDWFWWYGDDHYTVQAGTFDYLFRSNLINAYRLLNENVPGFLYEPIKKNGKSIQSISKPKNYIYPKVNGRIDSYFEYLGASRVNLKYDMSSMNVGESILTSLVWGFDERNFYFCLELDKEKVNEDDTFVELKILSPFEHVIKYYFKNGKIESSISDDLFQIVYEEVLEGSIGLNLFETKRVSISFCVVRGGAILDRAPVYNPLEIKLDSLDSKDWLV